MTNGVINLFVGSGEFAFIYSLYDVLQSNHKETFIGRQLKKNRNHWECL